MKRLRDQEGGRPPDPDRDRRLAQPGRPDQGRCSRPCPRRSGTATSRSTATTPGPGPKLAFGEDVDPVYHFDRADVILSLDADFLACGSARPGADERAFAARREPKQGAMNRLYVAESLHQHRRQADHRLPSAPARSSTLARRLPARRASRAWPAAAGLTEPQAKFAAAVGRTSRRTGARPGHGRRRASPPTCMPWATRSTRPRRRSARRGRSRFSRRSRPTRSTRGLAPRAGHGHGGRRGRDAPDRGRQPRLHGPAPVGPWMLIASTRP